MKVDSVAEGEAQRYFDHAITLRDTILFLRYNRDLGVEPDQVPAKGLGKWLVYGPVFKPLVRRTDEFNKVSLWWGFIVYVSIFLHRSVAMWKS